MIIFDLDGTLADCEHRRHFVKKYVVCDHWHQIPNHPVDMCDECKIKHRQWKPNWQVFYEACDQDKPIEAVIDIWNMFEVAIAVGTAPLKIWSGRCESVREKTIEWIENNMYVLDKEWINSILKMRPIGDSTPDDQLKERWLDESCKHISLNLETGQANRNLHGIDFVIDSNPESIRMWRRRGIFVFDVNQSVKEF